MRGKVKIIFLIYAMIFGLQNCEGLSQSTTDPSYLFDEHHIRYQLVVKNSQQDEKTLNWLFIPEVPAVTLLLY
jgi:hypothetical protein